MKRALFNFLSRKGTLNRKGFICIFVCAIVSVYLLGTISFVMIEINNMWCFPAYVTISISITMGYIIKRCHDMECSWYFCLIPFYNPCWLLMGKRARTFEEED